MVSTELILFYVQWMYTCIVCHNISQNYVTSLQHTRPVILYISCLNIFKLTKIVHYIAGKHSIFGRVSDGMTIVKRIGLVTTDDSDR